MDCFYCSSEHFPLGAVDSNAMLQRYKVKKMFPSKLHPLFTDASKTIYDVGFTRQDDNHGNRDFFYRHFLIVKPGGKFTVVNTQQYWSLNIVRRFFIWSYKYGNRGNPSRYILGRKYSIYNEVAGVFWKVIMWRG